MYIHTHTSDGLVTENQDNQELGMSQEKMQRLSASEYHSDYKRVMRFLFTEGDSITVLFFHLRPIGESVSSGKAFLNML